MNDKLKTILKEKGTISLSKIRKRGVRPVIKFEDKTKYKRKPKYKLDLLRD